MVKRKKKLPATILIFYVFNFICFSQNTVVTKNERDINIPVLMYHEFCAESLPKEKDPYDLYTTIDVLEENIKTLLDNGYTFIDFDDLYRFCNGTGSLSEKSVIITCDDGYISNYELAYPIFKKYSVKAIIFVVDALVGRPEYFTWEQAKEMENSGLVDICTHGKQHVDYSKISTDNLVDEINQAYKNLQDNLGADRLKIFAYPYGANTAATRAALKEQGFCIQVLTRCGHTLKTKNIDLAQINRIKGWNGMTGKKIIQIAEADAKS